MIASGLKSIYGTKTRMLGCIIHFQNPSVQMRRFNAAIQAMLNVQACRQVAHSKPTSFPGPCSSCRTVSPPNSLPAVSVLVTRSFYSCSVGSRVPRQNQYSFIQSHQRRPSQEQKRRPSASHTRSLMTDDSTLMQIAARSSLS